MSLAPVTAASTRITSYTIHGWRPTSVVIQPAISATTDRGPLATTERSRSRGRDPRRRNRRNKYTRPISASRVPIPTMVWNENRTTFTGGWSDSGTMFSPLTTAFGLWKASKDKSRGISMPQTTACPLYQPSRCSAAPRVVVARPSIAASLTGW
jgi:hypothetical protein